MENYREKLKVNIIITAIASFILAAFCFLAAAGEAGIFPFFVPTAGDSHWQSMWRGFCCGASFGILAMMLFSLIRNVPALRNDEKLKKLYVKEHDERAIQIWTSARAAGLQTFLLLGLVATVVAGYFSVPVSLTLLACVFAASLISLAFKIYYSQKF